jgi:predicted nucleotidyltransferase
MRIMYAMSLSTVQFHLEDINISLQEVKDLVALPEWKILNVYMYGSRVYGTFHQDSDFDFLVLANSLDREKELKRGRYNIHIHTPDKFQDDLWAFHMVNMECIFAPSFAKLQEKIEYRKAFGFDPFKLKKSILKQSHDSWMKSKMKFREMDLERATKSLFHSLRMLLFGAQLVEEGEIVDFSEANHYWEEISGMEEYKWNVFKEKFLPLKKQLEEMLMDAKSNAV